MRRIYMHKKNYWYSTGVWNVIGTHGKKFLIVRKGKEEHSLGVKDLKWFIETGIAKEV